MFSIGAAMLKSSFQVASFYKDTCSLRFSAIGSPADIQPIASDPLDFPQLSFARRHHQHPAFASCSSRRQLCAACRIQDSGSQSCSPWEPSFDSHSPCTTSCSSYPHLLPHFRSTGHSTSHVLRNLHEVQIVSTQGSRTPARLS